MVFVDENKFKKEIGIYKIKNLKNNKTYIGQTGQNFQKRYWHHKWKLENNSHDNTYLQNEWNKYGEDNFEFSVVEIVDKENLDERERYWILKYRENNICLNMQDGGQPIHIERFISEESRKMVGNKNREYMLGRKMTEETKKKMSETRKNLPHINKKTDTITEEQAKTIKEMFVQGFTSHEIMEITNIPYKPINGILSANNWKKVYVDGWEEFRENRPKGKGSRAQGVFNNVAKRKTDEEIQEIISCYCKYRTYLKVSKELNIGRATVKKYVDIYCTSCQSCAKSQK